MILYGTKVPAQSEDPVNQGSPFLVYSNDMAHNDIEHDASGQWRNMQQVGATLTLTVLIVFNNIYTSITCITI